MIKLPLHYERKLGLMARHLGISAEDCLINLIDSAAKALNVVLIPPHQLAIFSNSLILLSDHRYYVFNKSSAADLRENLRRAVDRRKKYISFELDGVTWLGQSPLHNTMSAEADPRYTILFTHDMAQAVLDQLERMIDRAEIETV